MEPVMSNSRSMKYYEEKMDTIMIEHEWSAHAYINYYITQNTHPGCFDLYWLMLSDGEL